MKDRLIIPGLRIHHLIILGLSFYLLQAIATADGAFKLNHGLAIAVKENGYTGLMKSLGWLNTSADQFDKWSADQFGKDPWAVQGDMMMRFTSDCVTTPVPGFLSDARISRFHNEKKKSLNALGRPMCVAVSGNWRWLTDDPNQVFEVNPGNLNQYGTVEKPKSK